MSTTIYLILAELTVIIHMLFVIFVVVGGFFAKRWRWMTVIHLIAVAWAVYAELSPGVACPLTTLENYFGYLAGLSTYHEGFIMRYLIPIIYQESLTPSVQYILVGFVVVINVVAYRINWNKKPTSRKKNRI